MAANFCFYFLFVLYTGEFSVYDAAFLGLRRRNLHRFRQSRIITLSVFSTV